MGKLSYGGLFASLAKSFNEFADDFPVNIKNRLQDIVGYAAFIEIKERFGWY